MNKNVLYLIATILALVVISLVMAPKSMPPIPEQAATQAALPSNGMIPNTQTPAIAKPTEPMATAPAEIATPAPATQNITPPAEPMVPANATMPAAAIAPAATGVMTPFNASAPATAGGADDVPAGAEVTGEPQPSMATAPATSAPVTAAPSATMPMTPSEGR